MANLAIKYADILRAVGRLVGWGDAYSDWSSDTAKLADAREIIRSGLRRFYFPLPIADAPAHQWSFLCPAATLEIVSGVSSYLLPPDFVSMKSEFTFPAATANVPLEQIPEAQLRNLVQHEDRSGKPEHYAIRAAVGGDQEPRYEVIFYPKPDAGFTLTYRYSISPPELTDDAPYHLGGSQHSETVLEACLASAEKFINDEEAVHDKQFRELLTASIAMDKTLLADETAVDVWPYDADQTGLLINKAYLKRLIGVDLKFGPHLALWTHTERKKVDTVLEMGLRKFYSPLVLPGEKYSHEWSFLRPLGQMELVGGKHTYDLPDDFAMFFGPLTFAPNTTTLYPPIQIRGEEFIRQRRQHYESSSRPAFAAVVPKRPGAGGLTRYELTVWPTPDTTYTVHFRYQISPGSLSDEQELPIGGQEHAQTALEACLSASEEFRGVGEGLHTRKFMERLRASVSFDRKMNAPEHLGYNKDGRRTVHFGEWHDYDENVVTYKGNTY